MDDYSTKVLSWLGISMVTTYRILWVKLYKNIRQAEERNKRKRNENIKILNKLITNDTEALMNWMKDDQTDTTWMEPVTKHESIKFQMVLLVDEFVNFTYRIIVLQNTTVDKEALLKWIGENVKKITVCNRDDNKVVTKSIKDNYSTLTDLIVNDKKTFISMIAGDHEKLDEKTKQDIKTLTEMNWPSSSNTYRNYDIIVLPKTSNKKTMTELGARALFEPGCPSALNITSTKVELKWEEPSIGTDFIHFYQIFCEEQSSSWTCLFETPKHACNYVVEGLKPNAEYAFKIQAIKNGGNKGTISQTLIVSTLEKSCDRMAVDLFEPGCPSALDITSTKVELKWKELSKGTDFIHFYQIFCEEQSSSRRWLFETPRNDCYFVVEGLKPNTKYAFIIQAVKNGQNKGPISKTLTVSTLEISCDRMAEFLYVLFYIAVLIWFTYLFCYSLTAT